jgi:hypothetical protein
MQPAVMSKVTAIPERMAPNHRTTVLITKGRRRSRMQEHTQTGRLLEIPTALSPVAGTAVTPVSAQNHARR